MSGARSRLTGCGPGVLPNGWSGAGNSVPAAGEIELRDFLSDLATRQRVAVATQRQALNAVVFLMREALGKPLADFGDFTKARRGERVPVVLSRAECQRLLAALEATPRLMAELMYGSGVRLMELLRLRIKDVDVERRQLVVRAGKGGKDRVTVLPEVLVERLLAHRERLRQLHAEDREAEAPGVWLPEGLDRKYPQAGQGVGMAVVFSVAGADERSAHGLAAAASCAGCDVSTCHPARRRRGPDWTSG